MRTYYASDKKRREDAKRKQQEQKRLKRLNKNAGAKGVAEAETGPVPGGVAAQPEASSKTQPE